MINTARKKETSLRPLVIFIRSSFKPDSDNILKRSSNSNERVFFRQVQEPLEEQ